MVGYSFGADVAPFLVNRLPAAFKARVASVVLLAPSHNASFSFHFTDWLGGPAKTGTPTTPEIVRLTVPVVCIYPEDEPGSVCRSVSASPTSRAVAVGRGHHFSDEYDRLVATILSSTAHSPAGHIQDERCSTGLLAR